MILFFSKIRRYLLSEEGIAIPLGLIFFLVCLNYQLLKLSKDSLIIPLLGVEAVPFLKIWGLIPASILSTFAFSWLAFRLDFEKLTYLMLSCFIGFFAVFGFLLYPNHSVLHPLDWARELCNYLPTGLHPPVLLVGHWTFASFYIACELWGTLIMSLLFWGLVNEITSVDRAGYLYSYLSIVGNISSIAGGSLGEWIARESEEMYLSTILLTGVAVSMAVLFALLFRMKGYRGGLLKEKRNPTTSKISTYSLCIAIMVIGYSLSVNLLDLLWKGELCLLCPDRGSFQAYLGRVTTVVGILGTAFACLPAFALRFVSWGVFALACPTIVFITGGCFLIALLSREFTLADVPLANVVLLGAIQNCLTRASKYTLFDVTKEMAFIPLARDEKLHSKALIDGMVSRFGKSGASFCYQLLIFYFGTLSRSLPAVSAILSIILSSWMGATVLLGRLFQKRMSKK